MTDRPRTAEALVETVLLLAAAREDGIRLAAAARLILARYDADRRDPPSFVDVEALRHALRLHDLATDPASAISPAEWDEMGAVVDRAEGQGMTDIAAIEAIEVRLATDYLKDGNLHLASAFMDARQDIRWLVARLHEVEAERAAALRVGDRVAVERDVLQHARDQALAERATTVRYYEGLLRAESDRLGLVQDERDAALAAMDAQHAGMDAVIDAAEEDAARVAEALRSHEGSECWDARDAEALRLHDERVAK